MTDQQLAEDVIELLNTKERLIFHLITVIEEDLQRKPNAGVTPAAAAAIRYLVDIGGYSPGNRHGRFPPNRHRWEFMLEHGEPGTHIRPKIEKRIQRARDIEAALFGVLATLMTAKRGGQIGHIEQVEKAIECANNALEKSTP